MRSDAASPGVEDDLRAVLVGERQGLLVHASNGRRTLGQGGPRLPGGCPRWQHPHEAAVAGMVLGLALLAAGLVVVGVVGVWVVADDDSTTSTVSPAVAMHGTRPPRLVADDIARASEAFGIDAEPERIVGGWEAEDSVRSLYLVKSPSAWYFTFEDASTPARTGR